MKKIIALLTLLLLMSCSPPYRKSFNAAVRIDGGTGSGVLLEDGWHILTAAHVVDSNMNGIVDEGEKESSVTIGESAEVYSATVVRIDGWVVNGVMKPAKDLALLRLSKHVDGGARVSTINPKIGDEVYTIGCPNAVSLHITTGIVSTLEFGLRKTSCSVYYGNSGGGLFSSNGSLVGILSMVNTDSRTFIQVVINTTSLFVTNKQIIKFLGPDYHKGLLDKKHKRDLAILSLLSLIVYAAIERKILLD